MMIGWMCSKEEPICRVELNSSTFKPIVGPINLIKSNPSQNE